MVLGKDFLGRCFEKLLHDFRVPLDTLLFYAYELALWPMEPLGLHLSLQQGSL